MIVIAAERITPRLGWIADILFRHILKAEYMLIRLEELNSVVGRYPACSLIFYHKENIFREDSTVIPAENILFENDIHPQAITHTSEPYIKLWFSPRRFTSFSLDFDVFASAFYLASEYEKYVNLVFDAHGRYEESAYESFRLGWHKLPLLNIYAEALWDMLHKKNPILERQSPKFDYSLSFDIDSPYLYKGKPVAIQAGSAIKDLLGFNFRSLGTRLSGRDPYDVYDYIGSQTNGRTPLFFYLIDRNSANDGRHTWQSEAYRALIRQQKGNGVVAGIHPSYTSFEDPTRILNEKRRLEEILDEPVTNSRMHFLKYRLPWTMRFLEMAGITDDYTMCNIHSAGFHNFTAMPIPWFDLERNRISCLMLHPTMVMDRSLQKYSGMRPEGAVQAIKDMIDTAALYHGHFTILFHNSTLSELGEWRGWREVYEKTLIHLAEASE